ncbi:serine threonine- kinase RIO1-like [Olea europaea subsp. europaea]|uniref:Serine threonine- kinase RIO1-like n=1 Tax=Olea europaea subsp. europaea TaxID=158383 RepID=A0A8S0UPZ8_OLEEU|nr:serine threonine- kinase RIO1-like [Olea europaea subsp. europaea]
MIAVSTEKAETINEIQHEEGGGGGLSWLSESEVGKALDFLDSREDTENGITDGSFTLLHTRRPNPSSLRPISNKSQKLAITSEPHLLSYN